MICEQTLIKFFINSILQGRLTPLSDLQEGTKIINFFKS